MIEFDNVVKIYKMGHTEYKALQGISFTIAAGELVSIIGPSGSGKSTTMNILGFLDKPSAGKYLLNGIDSSEFSRNQLAKLRNQKIGFIFQSFFLLPKLTALQNVGLPLYYANENAKTIRERSMEMLQHVEMERFAHHKPTELSGGQKQRVAIARALVGKPDLILADEPTGALDSKTTESVLQLIINRMQGATVVIITHDMNIAKRCPRIIEIRDGVIQVDRKTPSGEALE